MMLIRLEKGFKDRQWCVGVAKVQVLSLVKPLLFLYQRHGRHGTNLGSTHRQKPCLHMYTMLIKAIEKLQDYDWVCVWREM